MRRSSVLGFGLVLALAMAGGAEAATLAWEGSARVTLVTGLNFAPIFTGTGVATVNGSGGGVNLSAIRLAGGISGTQTTLLTDPDNPDLVSLIGTASMGTGTFTSIAGGAINGNATRPIPGMAKVCILLPGCGTYVVVPFTLNGGTVGLGVGGTITANTFAKQGNAFKASVTGNPWTFGVTSVTDVETRNHAEPTTNPSPTTMTTGFLHGPVSLTSTAAQVGGVIQHVTAGLVLTSLDPPSDRQAMLAFTRLHFVPEPGVLLLLGSGVAGLVLIGRSRMQR
jgi:hypothetical protein